MTGVITSPSRPTLRELGLAALLFLLFWGTALHFGGVLTPGYDLMDDHTILDIEQRLESGSLRQTIAHYVQDDLKIRIRSLYWVTRVIAVQVLGSNFLLWSLLNLGLAAVSSVALYAFGRLCSLTAAASAFLALIALIGLQVQIWVLRGNSETMGTVLNALTLVSVAALVAFPRWRAPLSLLAFVLTALTCGYKEAYVLLIPAYCFLLLWLEIDRTLLTWREALQRHRVLIAAWSVFMLGMIKLTVGATPISYAGVDASTFGRLLASVQGLDRRAGLKFCALATGLALIAALLRPRENLRATLLDAARRWWPVFLFLTLWIGPQIVLYAKSGFSYRYRMPSYIGIAFFMAWIFSRAQPDEPLLRRGMLALLLLYVGLNVPFMQRDIVRYGAARQHLARLLEATASAASRTGPTVIVGMNTTPEWLGSLRTYLILKQQYEPQSLFLECQPTPAADGIEIPQYDPVGIYQKFNGNAYAELPASTPVKSVIVFADCEARFLKEHAGRFDPARYLRRELSAPASTYGSPWTVYDLQPSIAFAPRPRGTMLSWLRNT